MEAHAVRRLLTVAILLACVPAGARAQSDITGEWAPLFHEDQVDRVPGLAQRAAGLRRRMCDLRIEHKKYIVEHGEDMPIVRNWRWPDAGLG